MGGIETPNRERVWISIVHDDYYNNQAHNGFQWMLLLAKQLKEWKGPTGLLTWNILIQKGFYPWGFIVDQTFKQHK